MISLRHSAATSAMSGELIGEDSIFHGVSTDSREVRSGELFFALKGEQFDGHDMCESAVQKGAAACVVEREVSISKPHIKVPNTRLALGELARYWRMQHQTKLIGVTGSNGKTTTKEMLAAIFGGIGKVLATKGNFNNDIGLPKTLFELSEEHEFCVIEMGANHIGEIAQLAGIAKPQVGIITLCAPAHLEGFGSIEGVAEAKGEIFSALPADGTAIINADDRFCDYWREISSGRNKITFGLNPETADVYATKIEGKALGCGTTFSFHYGEELRKITIPHDGLHNVLNALAAGAGALGLGCSLDQIANGLAQSEIVSGRLNFHRLKQNVQLIDDTYNANPSSLMAAVNVAANSGCEHWVVMGDMGELGDEGAEIHEQCGSDIKASGATYLFTFGELAGFASRAFGPNGLHFENKDRLSQEIVLKINERQAKPLVILIKGSRFTQMETVVETVRENAGAVAC